MAKSKQRGGFKGSGLNVEYPQSGAGRLQQRSNVMAREACDAWLPRQSVSHSTQIHIKSSLNCHLPPPPSFGLHQCGGWGRGVGFSSVVLHPAVLLYKGIDHFLHGQVRDQLVLGQRTPGDWVKMAYPLQSHRKMESNSLGDIICCCFQPSNQRFSVFLGVLFIRRR